MTFKDFYQKNKLTAYILVFILILSVGIYYFKTELGKDKKDISHDQTLIEVEEELNKALELDPNNVFAHSRLGLLYTVSGKYEEAAIIFSTLHTNAARFGMAQIYFDTGNYRQGIDILKELTVYDMTGKINVLYLDKMYEYAEQLFKMEHYKESIDIYMSKIPMTA